MALMNKKTRNNLLAGGVSGAAQAYLGPGYMGAVADIAIGVGMKNDTLQTLGGRQLGAALSGGLFNGGSSSAGMI